MRLSPYASTATIAERDVPNMPNRSGMALMYPSLGSMLWAIASMGSCASVASGFMAMEENTAAAIMPRITQPKAGPSLAVLGETYFAIGTHTQTAPKKLYEI